LIPPVPIHALPNRLYLGDQSGLNHTKACQSVIGDDHSTDRTIESNVVHFCLAKLAPGILLNQVIAVLVPQESASLIILRK
jgi:hypothetical protein